ncbi:MAG TPA: ABC transporter permease [Planctomycetaceae bacterium]|nr:ABC transporter permease [Planctomycetaceae bacterium]HIQ21784.1 ABC transporter permease [Planctomycetota bacterium]
MVVEKPVPEFWAWLPWALLNWGLTVVILAMVAVGLGFLGATLRYGPRVAWQKVLRLLRAIPEDLLYTSPRRLWALTRLAVKEAVRRRVVVGFAVFIVVLLFAGWFLDPTSEHPAQLYLSFVLDATGYLVLLMALFLSALSLPSDIRYRTIHTVVTKPVRPTEIVLGRIFGFTLVGTVLLLVMAPISYAFVLRGLAHTHTLSAEDLSPVDAEQTASDAQAKVGYTDRVRGHRHRVQVEPVARRGPTEVVRDHWHEWTVDRSGGETRYRLSGPRGMLQARVPVYGKLRFRDTKGFDIDKGIDVGDEWTYRTYIQGATEAASVWTFQGVTEDRFPEGLPVEMTLGVFRTHKGKIEREVLGALSVRNPRTGLTVEVEIFESKEFSVKQIWIPRKITEFSGAEVIPRRQRLIDGSVDITPPPERMNPELANRDEFDLFEDLVDDGTVEIWLQCLEGGQYFGAAQADLYLRAADAPFVLNFLKGYVGIWLQMVLVIAFGVMFSTLVSAPVALVAQGGVMLLGFFKDFMVQLGRGELIGGGPSEALVRLVKQENLVIQLNPGLGTKLVKMFDTVAELFIRAMAALLPPLSDFSFVAYVADGYNISANLLAVRTLTALAFLIPVALFGYLFLKTREVAQ